MKNNTTFSIRVIDVITFKDGDIRWHIEPQGIEPYVKDINLINWESGSLRALASFLNKIADYKDESLEEPWNLN